MNFCTRPSRLFSGDPSALLAVDSQYLVVSDTLVNGLSTPFQFVLDSPQVPNTQFWHIPKLTVLITTPAPNAILNLGNNQMAMFLCPGSMVGSIPQDDSGSINGINTNNLGIFIGTTFNNLLNDNTNQGGIQELEYEVPIEVPPLWFLRFIIFDDNTGPNVLFAGSQVSMRMQQQIIDVKFASQT